MATGCLFVLSFYNLRWQISTVYNNRNPWILAYLMSFPRKRESRGD